MNQYPGAENAIQNEQNEIAMMAKRGEKKEHKKVSGIIHRNDKVFNSVFFVPKIEQFLEIRAAQTVNETPANC